MYPHKKKWKITKTFCINFVTHIKHPVNIVFILFSVLCPIAGHQAAKGSLNDLIKADKSSFFKVWHQQYSVPFFLILVLFPLCSVKSPTFFTKFNSLGEFDNYCWKYNVHCIIQYLEKLKNSSPGNSQPTSDRQRANRLTANNWSTDSQQFTHSPPTDSRGSCSSILPSGLFLRILNQNLTHSIVT